MIPGQCFSIMTVFRFFLFVLLFVDVTQGKYRRYFGYDPFKDWDVDYYDSALDDLKLAAPPPPTPPDVPVLQGDAEFTLRSGHMSSPFASAGIMSRGFPLNQGAAFPFGVPNSAAPDALFLPQRAPPLPGTFPSGGFPGLGGGGALSYTGYFPPNGGFAYNLMVPQTQQIYGDNRRLLGLQPDIFGNQYPNLPPSGYPAPGYPMTPSTGPIAPNPYGGQAGFGSPLLPSNGFSPAFPQFQNGLRNGVGPYSPMAVQNSPYNPALSSPLPSRPPIVPTFSNYDNKGFYPKVRPRPARPLYVPPRQASFPAAASENGGPRKEPEIFIDIPLRTGKVCRPFPHIPSVTGYCKNSFDIIKNRACRNMEVESQNSECGTANWCCYWKPPGNHFPKITPLSLDTEEENQNSNKDSGTGFKIFTRDSGDSQGDYFRLPTAAPETRLSGDQGPTSSRNSGKDSALKITFDRLKPEAIAADRSFEEGTAKLVPRFLAESSVDIGGDFYKNRQCGRTGSAAKNIRQLEGHPSDRELCWQAAIFLDNEYICGGSLISETDILTTASCLQRFANKELDQLRIVLGATSIETSKAPGSCAEVHNVRQINLHALFDTKTMANDIAIAKLRRPVEMNKCVCMICLPDSNTESMKIDSSCLLAGYGSPKNVPYDGGSDGRLSAYPIQIINSTTGTTNCQGLLNSFSGTPRGFHLDSSMFCSISKDVQYSMGYGKGDACMKDNGAPLVCQLNSMERDRWTLAGVVTYGLGCGRTKESTRMPSVYTNVRKQIEWIRKNMH